MDLDGSRNSAVTIFEVPIQAVVSSPSATACSAQNGSGSILRCWFSAGKSGPENVIQ